MLHMLMAPLCLGKKYSIYLGASQHSWVVSLFPWVSSWGMAPGYQSGSQTLRKQGLTETSLMARAEMPSWWVGRRAT